MRILEIEERLKVKLSVRDLVEFILNSGDIDNRRSGGSTLEAMQEGGRLHRKIQKSMGIDYTAEVSLQKVFLFDDFDIILEGRADGIIVNDDGVTIDEIKGVFADMDRLTEPVEVHLAQAKCYALIYGQENNLSQIAIQITYIQMETERIKRFNQNCTMDEIQSWFNNVMKQYEQWVRMQIGWRETRNYSIRNLDFPFDYREGQKQLVTDVYRSILRKKNLFIQAPTGAGKTIATVFPSIKAVGEGLAEKIFYFTAKTITRTVALQTYKLLVGQGLENKVLVMTAKEKSCLQEKMSCNPVDCIYAKGHFDRVNEAVFDMINNERVYTKEVIEEYARKHQVCPFEMGLDASLWADAIICDYNYVFDPNVYLKRFFEDGVKGDYIFLVDEAHNLVDRGRSMYSAVLYKDQFLKIKKIVSQKSKKLSRSLDKCNRILLDYKRECDQYQKYDQLTAFHFALLQLQVQIEEFSAEYPTFDGGEEWSDFFLRLRHFCKMYDNMGEDYVIYGEHDEDGRFLVKLFCVDTARLLGERTDKSVSTIFFSATLLPIQYYKEMLCTQEDPYAIYASSTFSQNQRLLLIGGDVSSKYTRRSLAEYRKIASYIEKLAKSKIGNYMVFFPSYRFMEDVSQSIHEDDFTILKQGVRMGEQEKEIFLGAFSEVDKQSKVGFCVMGGIFSEGIDLTNDQLIGAVIVGTGFPQMNNERELLKNYYNDKCKNGFDYAFRFPGLNKVEQSAGRVIRTTQDKGVILLLDDRFLHQENKQFFPREWSDAKECSLNNVQEEMIKFWEENE